MSEHKSCDGHSYLDMDDLDACAAALRNVHAFLHGELPDSEADHIRAHLMACERCLGNFDTEQIISEMIRRCYPPMHASEELRNRIVSMTSISIRVESYE